MSYGRTHKKTYFPPSSLSPGAPGVFPEPLGGVGPGEGGRGWNSSGTCFVNRLDGLPAPFRKTLKCTNNVFADGDLAQTRGCCQPAPLVVRGQFKVRRTRLFFCLLAAVLGLSCGGCGCQQDPDSDAEKTSETAKEDEEPKDRFTAEATVLYPGEFSDEARVNRFKPGHLATASLRIQSNLSDSAGRLSGYGVVQGGTPVPLEGTSFYLESSRQVTLVKGEQKNIESLVYLPHRDLVARNVTLRQQMLALSGLPLVDVTQPVIALRGWQYHLLVLSDLPDQLRYIEAMDCVQLRATDMVPPPPFYHVVRPGPSDPVPLSGSSLAWTTLAAIVWDGFDPERLDDAQRRALKDWLHFGGQLVISGPGSLDRLQASFLQPWLPVRQAGSRNLGAAELAELNANWSIPMARNPERQWKLEVPVDAPMLGVDLQLTPESQFIAGTGGLVAERWVGRGRVVVTGFPLHDQRLKRWAAVSSLFNNALLRKPSRRFSVNESGSISFGWRNVEADTFDPLVGSTVRFLCRDLMAGRETGRLNVESEFGDDGPGSLLGGQRLMIDNSTFGDGSGLWDEDRQFVRAPDGEPAADPLHFDGHGALDDSGVGGWNDNHGVTGLARETISRAAGIRPPSRMFVIQMLAAYLAVLVPLNWLVFRAIGRVEWAWIAAPLIAIAGAWAVVRLAALDIGFVRSHNRLGLLEIPVGHDRGHVAEFSAVYSSLSTRFAARFGESDGISMPLGFPGTSRTALTPVQFERMLTGELSGFPVQSNSTGLLHTESMIDLAGTVALHTGEDGLRLVNGTRLRLGTAGIVRRTEDGQLELAWIGMVEPGSEVALTFERVEPDQAWQRWRDQVLFVGMDRYCSDVWERSAMDRSSLPLDEAVAISGLEPSRQTQFREYLLARVRELEDSRGVPDEQLVVEKNIFAEVLAQFALADQDRPEVGALFDLVASQLELLPGQARLIAEMDESPATWQLVPAATRNRASILVVAHLSRPVVADPRPDLNTLQDFLAKPDQDRWMEELEAEGDAEETDESGEPDMSDDSTNSGE